MTLSQWFANSAFDNPSVNNRWGTSHIIVLLTCVLVCVGTYFLRNRSEKLRVWIIRGVAIALYHFELIRRIVNFVRTDVPINELLSNKGFWYDVLPRPWCAISVWLIIISTLVNKKFFYNIASMNAIICVIIFFAYPSAGFNNQYMQFENIYSIGTHALLFVGGVSMITMGLTEFKYTRTRWYNSALRELVAIVLVFCYAFLQIFVLKIQHNADPMYFMPTGTMDNYVNEVQDIVGLSGPLYVIGYILFLALYFNIPYLIRMAIDKNRAKRALENVSADGAPVEPAEICE